LGLALAKNIVKAMGGDISVESELGLGSTFTIHIPVATESERSRAKVLSQHFSDASK
jgi:signal transduction histidine kinase